MRISRGLAVAVTGASLAAAATLPAVAGTTHHPASKGSFKSTVSPSKVHSGQKITLKASGAEKNTNYTCVIIAAKGANYAIGHIIGATKSSSKGKFTCSTTFEPFSSKPLHGSSKVSCPPTKAEKKSGWKCGFAASTLDKKSNTVSYFTAKK